MNRLGNKTGFSLIEVLIGVAIFLIGMLGMAALLVSSVSGNSFAGNLTEATTLGASKMEVLMGLPLADPALRDSNRDGHAGLDAACAAAVDPGCASPADGCDGCASAADGVGRNKIYRVYWNISPNDPEADLTSIKVIVKWRVKGTEHCFTVDGIRSGVM